MMHVSASGDRVPVLGLGTWQLEGWSCRTCVAEALGMGYRHLDTAQMYENEADVGAGIRDSAVDRDELFVTTKLARGAMRADEVRRSAQESLRRLGLDHVDLLLIHWPSDEVPVEETLEAMMRLQERGEVRHLGVSNFPPAHFDQARRVAPLSCLQVEYHPFLQQTELRGACRSAGMMLAAYCPLARGGVVRDPTLQEIGRRHDKSAAQVALRWLVQQEQLAAIPKASRRDHLAENLDIFDFSLSPQEMGAIFCLERGERLIDPSWAPDWTAKPRDDLQRRSRRAPAGPARTTSGSREQEVTL